jgi:hypothetical protein
MALLNFKDYLESSPLTRARDGWARYGNYPPTASAMSHSTPAPFMMKKIKKALSCKNSQKVDEQYKKSDKIKSVTHKEIDGWLKSIDDLAKDLEELKKLQKTQQKESPKDKSQETEKNKQPEEMPPLKDKTDKLQKPEENQPEKPEKPNNTIKKRDEEENDFGPDQEQK